MALLLPIRAMRAESGQWQRASGRVPVGSAGAPLGAHSGDAGCSPPGPRACMDGDRDGGMDVADSVQDAPVHDDGGYDGGDMGDMGDDDGGPPRASSGGDSAGFGGDGASGFGSVIGDAAEESAAPAAGGQVRRCHQQRNAARVS